MGRLHTKSFWWFVAIGIVMIGVGIVIIPVLHIGYLEKQGTATISPLEPQNESAQTYLRMENTWGIWAQESGNFAILDRTSPLSPSVIARHETSHRITEIFTIDKAAIMVDNTSGVYYYNLSNPQLPTLITQYIPEDQIITGVKASDYFVVLLENGQISFFDWTATNWTVPYKSLNLETNILDIAAYQSVLY